LQDPWIQNATLRNNVLMGRSYEQAAYERAIHASCLGQDLEVSGAALAKLELHRDILTLCCGAGVGAQHVFRISLLLAS
jgi:hypothetical protein